MKFLHISDIHLGFNQYQLEERTRDFGRAWAEVLINHAIKNEVDFVLICGDFFDKRVPTAQAFDQAFLGLAELHKHNIPAVAIEGNHDESQDNESEYSWLRSLRNAGLLKLLEPKVGKDENGNLKVYYQAWNDEEKEGSFIDIKGARIFGSRWYRHSLNAMIAPMIAGIQENSDENLFNILMLHTDVEGYEVGRHGHIAALSQANLQILKTCTHYVALGHTHKRIEIDNWAFNPGSLETCKVDEYKEERGAYIVEVDDAKTVKAAFIRDYHQRPFSRVTFDVDGYKEGKDITEGVIAKVEHEITPFNAENPQTVAPIIEITLRGHLGFPNSLLEFDEIRKRVQEMTSALHVRLKNNTVPVEYAVAADMSVEASREEREQRAIEDLIARDNRYKANSKEMAETVIGAKRMALNNDAPDKILDYISVKTV
jgi:DNA repair protein SbcD/Mre11